MNLCAQIAKHFNDVHYGSNWTGVNLKTVLENINWKQATTRVHSFNTIAALVYHINYYVAAILDVLEGKELNAHDKFSFDLKPLESEKDWQELLNKFWSDADKFVTLVEQIAESKLEEDFSDTKYGSYYRNLHGVIEHTHYHLGQIVLVKKLVLGNSLKSKSKT